MPFQPGHPRYRGKAAGSRARQSYGGDLHRADGGSALSGGAVILNSSVRAVIGQTWIRGVHRKRVRPGGTLFRG
jgi:hypothetical protein